MIRRSLASARRRTRDLTSVVRFRGQFKEFRRSAVSDGRFEIRWSERRPFLHDDTGATHFDRHYIYHPAWAARVLQETRPRLHVDIGSIIYFPAILSAVVPVHYFEFRPADITLEGLSSRHADLTQLHFADRSLESLSCMHTVEHIGLGRYGDPIDATGDLRAMHELQRVTAEGGSLLFVVPVGKPRLQFNAHRIYGYDQIVDAFSELELVEFALIPDTPSQGGLIRNADPALVLSQSYGCGCFHFRR